MREGILAAYAFFTGHSLFLATFLFVKHRQSGNRLLGAILVLLTVRVCKSFLSLVLPTFALPVNTLGLVSMALLGPLLFFYSESLCTNPGRPAKKDYAHLIPAFVCVFAWSWPFVNIAYYIITFHLLCYLVYATVTFSKNAGIYKVDNIRWKWGKGVLLGLWAMFATFVLQLFFYKEIIYLVIIGLSVCLLYILSIWAIKQQKLFTDPVKKTPEPDNTAYKIVGKKVEALMASDIYTDTDLTLSGLAKKMSLQPYILSRAINVYFSMSFPELVSGYRIRKAEQLLKSDISKTYTIEAIAYESGFSTLSIFYRAFKKYKGITPAEYRKACGGG